MQNFTTLGQPLLGENYVAQKSKKGKIITKIVYTSFICNPQGQCTHFARTKIYQCMKPMCKNAKLLRNLYFSNLIVCCISVNFPGWHVTELIPTYLTLMLFSLFHMLIVSPSSSKSVVTNTTLESSWWVFFQVPVQPDNCAKSCISYFALIFKNFIFINH